MHASGTRRRVDRDTHCIAFIASWAASVHNKRSKKSFRGKCSKVLVKHKTVKEQAQKDAPGFGETHPPLLCMVRHRIRGPFCFLPCPFFFSSFLSVWPCRAMQQKMIFLRLHCQSHYIVAVELSTPLW